MIYFFVGFWLGIQLVAVLALWAFWTGRVEFVDQEDEPPTLNAPTRRTSE